MKTPVWRTDPRSIAEQIAHYEAEEDRIMDRLCMESHTNAEAKQLRLHLTTARYRLSVLRAETTLYVDESERGEDEPCEAGTVGCCVAHSRGDAMCQTW